jgi:hypothetical protein
MFLSISKVTLIAVSVTRVRQYRCPRHLQTSSVLLPSSPTHFRHTQHTETHALITYILPPHTHTYTHTNALITYILPPSACDCSKQRLAARVQYPTTPHTLSCIPNPSAQHPHSSQPYLGAARTNWHPIPGKGKRGEGGERARWSAGGEVTTRAAAGAWRWGPWGPRTGSPRGACWS